VKIENTQEKKMEKNYKKEGRYSYYEAGEGTPIVILHGLMVLSNFDVASYFSERIQNSYSRFTHLYTKSLKKMSKVLLNTLKTLFLLKVLIV
jgi:hypothetical protein